MALKTKTKLEDLISSDLGILDIIKDKKKVSHTKLADLKGISVNHLYKPTKRLIAHGYISSHKSRQDGRKTIYVFIKDPTEEEVIRILKADETNRDLTSEILITESDVNADYVLNHQKIIFKTITFFETQSEKSKIFAQELEKFLEHGLKPEEYELVSTIRKKGHEGDYDE